mgnify:CR=1 FL=1
MFNVYWFPLKHSTKRQNIFITFLSNKNDKQKIDELLRIDCSLYAHLGSDSTKGEKDDDDELFLKLTRY